MEEVKILSEQTRIVQKSDTCNYKLVIPAEVERRIRFVCQKVWDTEWSGTLFFTYEGSFENNDLVIRCEDIYVMDIGTQTYTEFDMNPDVIAYMCENTKLLNCQMGLIHSHNNMPSFFSGTDNNTLEEEGKDRNNFVSLIVNNAGNYTAAITRRVKARQTKESVSYEFFGEGERHDTKEYVSNVCKVEKFYLKIEKESDDFSFPDMAERLKEIRMVKENIAKEKSINLASANCITKFSPGPATIIKKEDKEPVATQGTLFDEYLRTISDGDSEIPYDMVSFNKEVIKSLVLQLITGSIFITDAGKTDLTELVKVVPEVYEKRFGKGKDGIDSFKVWAETFTEYLVWNTTDKELEELGFDETEICAICAHGMIEELTKLPKNDYIKVYINALQQYLKI